MLAAAVAYRPRAGPAAVLHAIVRDHLEEFLQAARAQGAGTGVPAFVETELRRFLTCGVLAHGFTRVRCDGCGFERLVPFACKGRGFWRCSASTCVCCSDGTAGAAGAAASPIRTPGP